MPRPGIASVNDAVPHCRMDKDVAAIPHSGADPGTRSHVTAFISLPRDDDILVSDRACGCRWLHRGYLASWPLSRKQYCSCATSHWALGRYYPPPVVSTVSLCVPVYPSRRAIITTD
jgi:hypothetical protein